MDYHDVSWKDVYKFVTTCTVEDDYDVVVGINRGGLPLAVLLSHKLHLPMIPITTSSYDGLLNVSPLKSISGYKKFFKKNLKVLLVDDISDSGKTLNLISNLLKVEFSCTVDTLTYVIKPNKTAVMPTYFCLTVPNEVWVRFPWEVYK